MWKVKVLVIQLCPIFCGPMGCNTPGTSVHGILQARILEWIATSFSRRSFRGKDRTELSCTAGRFLSSVSPEHSHLRLKYRFLFRRSGAAQTKRWAEGMRVPGPLAGGGSTTARGILRLCPESACQTGLPWSSPPA